MKEVVIGIGCFGHDASACVVDATSGKVLYAIAEERLSNIKHDWRFPIGAITGCMDFIEKNSCHYNHVAINFDDFEFVKGTLFSQVDFLVLDKNEASTIKDSISAIHPYADYFSFQGSYSKKYFDKQIQKLSLSAEIKGLLYDRIFCYFNWSVKYREIGQIVNKLFSGKSVHKINHHLCHAATAFYNSGFSEATVLTIDGQGESDTIGVYKCDANGIQIVSSTLWPFSIGIFYLNATKHLGFNIGDEYKVMGMAAYGKPTFLNTLREMMYVDGSAKVRFKETPYFSRGAVPGMQGHFYFNFTKAFDSLISVRKNTDEIKQIHFDLAASVQKLTEEIGVELARVAINLTGFKNICLAGGVALNGLMNEDIRNKSGISDIFIYPAAGDDGTSIGAAQFIAFKNNKIQPEKISTPFYGHYYGNSAIESVLIENKVKYLKTDNIYGDIASALSMGKIVARFYGGSEFGPRALGNRSILGNPMNADMKEILNRRIKHREPFRPFAPACMHEHVAEYFNIDIHSPFMLLITTAKELAQKNIPAVVHHDNTARVQTVASEHNPNFYRTLAEFKKITGVPVLINTSFNVNGEAIVETPLDAVESFIHMDIDYLAIGDFFVSKEENLHLLMNLSDAVFLKRRIDRYEKKIKHPLKEFDISSFYFMQGLESRTRNFSVENRLVSAIRKLFFKRI
jgi:carbamoyltransferase